MKEHFNDNALGAKTRWHKSRFMSVSKLWCIALFLLLVSTPLSALPSHPDEGTAYAACKATANAQRPSGTSVADCNPSVGGYRVYWRSASGAWINPIGQGENWHTYPTSNTCQARTSTSLSGIAPLNTVSCDQGCEYTSTSPGVYAPTGKTCRAIPTLLDRSKNNCCEVSGGAVSAGNPVNFNTGAKLESAVDFSAATGRLEFSRYHTSAWGLLPISEMGSAWRHTYMRKVVTVDSENVTVTRPSGDAYSFRKRLGVWMREPDVPYTLEEVASGGVFVGWLLKAPDDSEEHFDVDGRLTAITWTDGETLSFTYSGGLLASVVDTRGRRLTLTYVNGRVATVALPDGNSLAYTYDSWIRVSKVEINDGVSLKTLATYGYTHPAFNYSLTNHYDEVGALYATWSYDNVNRVDRSFHGSASAKVGELTFAYAPNTTTITDALGTQVVVGSTMQHGRAKSMAFNKLCPSCNGRTYSAQSNDVNGYADLRVDFKGSTTDFDYSPDGLQVKQTDSLGDPATERTTETVWHSMFRKPIQRDTRNASGNLLRSQIFAYNTRGQVLSTSIFDPATSISRTQMYGYCDAADVAANTCPVEGLLLSVDGPLAGTVDLTSYLYYAADAPTCSSTPTTCPYRKGDLWKVTNALGQVSEILRYDGAARVISTRDVNGVVTDREYHPRGWLTAVKVRGTDHTVETDDVITRIEYWPTGLVKRVTQPDGAYTQYTYDQAHRLTDVTDNVGNLIHYTLDLAGNRIKEETKNSSGVLKRTMSRVFNQLSQLTTQADAQANPTDFTYDANGNGNTVTDALGRVRDSDYDPLNRLSRTLQDVGGIEAETKLAYDPMDNLTKVTDPKGLDTTYTYNGLGDLTQLSSPDTGVTTYTYDAAGNRATQTDARGITSTYSYDALGRIAGIAYPTSSLNVAYVYDTTQAACIAGETYSIGRMTRMDDASGNTQYCYDRFGRMVRKVQTTNGIAFTVRYSWDKAGQLIGMVYPDGSEVDYTRNALGQIAAMGITRPGQAREVLLSQVTYLPFGPTTGWTYGNGRVMTRSYDQDYRPTAILDASPGGLSLGFGYDAVGNLTKLGTATGVATPDVVYGYDALGRLTRTADGPTNVAIDTYTYDKTGNRLTHVTAAGTSAYTYPATSHRLGSVGGSARTYDEIGNSLTSGSREFDYSDANRMNRVKNSGNVAMNYSYNGRGEQVNRNLGSTVTYSVYDEAGHWMGNYNGNGDSIQQALWMDDLPIGLLSNDHQIYYVEADHLGSPRVVLELLRNAVVWSWDSRGEVFGASSPSEDVDGDARSFVLDMRFPGQLFDTASGLGYNLSRDYDYSIGRYVTSDRIGLNGGISTYGYAHQAPMEFADPDGRAVVTLPFPIAPPPPHPLLLAAAAGTAIGLSFNAGYEGVRGRGFGIDIYDWTHADPVFNEVNEGDGAQAPGVPTEEDGYECPKNWDGKKVRSPNGKGYGWPDKKGNVWVPTGPGQGAHGGPHWDVQKAGGGYINVYPGGKTRGGR